MKDYQHNQGLEVEPLRAVAFTEIPVLTFLVGRQWNEDALNVVHALRPSWLRVVPPGMPTTDDGKPWRVTVHLDEAGNIASIDQEVTVGAVGRQNGSDVSAYIESNAPPAAPTGAGPRAVVSWYRELSSMSSQVFTVGEPEPPASAPPYPLGASSAPEPGRRRLTEIQHSRTARFCVDVIGPKLVFTEESRFPSLDGVWRNLGTGEAGIDRRLALPVEHTQRIVDALTYFLSPR
jgi:hypothetical protein